MLSEAGKVGEISKRPHNRHLPLISQAGEGRAQVKVDLAQASSGGGFEHRLGRSSEISFLKSQITAC